jgi:NADPH2:quinone reductase
MKAIRVHKTGGPEVLVLDDIEVRSPGAGEVRVRNHAIGVNFTDVYMRSGTFAPPSIPYTPGKEGAGEVLEVGEGVTEFSVGDRVAFVETLGAYAEECIVPTHYLFHLPEAISYQTAAAMLLKGLTAQFLLRRTFRVQAGQTILVHAATGGVGLILTQWAKHLGAVVIGTVGSREKFDIAFQNGCDHVINYVEEDFAIRVKQITNGKGCDVVYDSVGKATFQGSLDSLRPLGYFVSFGLASGPIPPFDLMLLAEKGSLFATWQALPAHLQCREDALLMSKELFAVVMSGDVKIKIHATMPLVDAAMAHSKLEQRKTMGAVVLLP